MAEYTGQLFDAPRVTNKPALREQGLSQKSQESLRLEKAKAEQEKATALPPADFSAKAKKLQDFEGYLTDYERELKKDLTVFPKEIPIIPSQGMAIPLPVGADTARMNSKYTSLLMGLKDAYELGALTGPDMSIVESQLTNPASISGALTSRNAMNEQVKVLRGILTRARSNLEYSYGRKINVPTTATANDPLGIR